MKNNNLVLVTGGNGFLAMHIIKQLLTAGYPVRATLRRLNRQDQVKTTLANTDTPNLNQLSFVQADLTKDADWPATMTDVTYVMSVAAPVFVNGNQGSEAMAQVATEGTLRIIKAAEKAGVKRVVMTANFGAVGFSNKDPKRVTTEADWTDPDEPGLSLYERSKLIAEKQAWDYLKKTNSSLEFTTVNPGAMLGPSLDNHVSGSFGIVKNLLDGSLKMVPNIHVNVVDVRDVADIHVRAMTTPEANGQRFLAIEDGDALSMMDMVAVIRKSRPELAAKLPTKTLPDFVLKLGALFNNSAKEGRLMLSLSPHVSNQKAKQVLGWKPISSSKTAILKAVDSLIAAGEIKA
ncbi:SDR family oxidoreductase [Secundilactobacillus hailunensis]|uniref:SDR family oxidoreductase n=1 Tax=Secundilactobacillus hailunensis TaxID=2559923 RepID=A0ABW1T754_9LACO|nr:aldehyde reductase [Secundilactobacillus hailunensis]